MQLTIFGAQGYALGTYLAIKEMVPARKIDCFLVSEMGMNAKTLAGIPVREIKDFSLNMSDEDKSDVEIIIGTPEMVHDEIEELLLSHGFQNIVRLTSSRWAELMDQYHAKLGSFTPLKCLPVGSVEPSLRIYSVKSHVDKALKNEYKMPEYMLPIQVGKALVDQKVTEVTDDIGDNISLKNGNYCELTALYWMWKNCFPVGKEQYYGLAQYRRRFELSQDDLLRLCSNEVDVLLPYPLPYAPDIQEHHKRYIQDEDWNVLIRVLEELQPEYAKAYKDILEQPFLYNYNVIIAKKEVMMDYCSWLFPILARVEELSVPKGSERSDRYIGYMGENLETLYFMYNADKLNIVHAGCRLLV